MFPSSQPFATEWASAHPVGRRLIAVLVVAMAGSLLLAAPAVDAADASGVVQIEALSTRADLVSDGDVLLEIIPPVGAQANDLNVDVDGRDVTAAFSVREDGRFLGLVDGLPLGTSQVTAVLPDGRGATLDVTNHPIQGPVFSGPHILPWACDDGADDEFCNREPAVELQYMPAGGGGLQPYDADNPPGDVATTTTDQGEEVPFIVRVERGVIARDNYVTAVLFDPESGWAPGREPSPGYNHKVVTFHGASCDTEYGQGSAPDALNEDLLGRGFATYSHAANNSGHNCNVVTQAEAMVMTKERLIDQYGEVRYMIGSGCSGGALAQYWMANAYPGLYQGITVSCSFMDAWSSANQYVDYDLLREYFESPEGLAGGWTPAQWEAVYGHPNAANAITFTEVIPNGGDPKGPCGLVAPEDTYDPETNPDGVRCSLQDWMVNVFGTDEAGIARRPYSNTGVQYGLSALLDGTIFPEQFVALNTGIGGWNDDYFLIDERVQSDELAAARVYRSGGNNTASNLDEVAIIDNRGPDPGAFHDTYRTYAIRERLIRQHGHADNMLLWQGPVALLGDATFTQQSILAMDRWLAAVEADERDVPLSQKIVEDRPEDVDHRCANGTGQDVPQEFCDTVVDVYSTPRIEAGAPTTDDVMRCVLVPIDDFDYSANPLFTDAHRDQLREAFPDGVCDYSQPDPFFTETVPWLSYATGPGGQPLGEPPTSIPFGPGSGPLRFAGPERTATAVAVSGRGVSAADTVVLASAYSSADALVAAPLAAALDAPLLLSDSAALSGTAAFELLRLGTDTVVLVGGPGAMTPLVADDLQALGITVERVGGADRFATAAAVADRMGVGDGEQYLASGDDFADALSASALAAAVGRPLLLTSADMLPAATAAALSAADDVTIAGGPAAVSDAVAGQVDAIVGRVARLAGADRYATSVAMAAAALDAGASTDVVWLATGLRFPDGLVAGAAAARDGGVLVLVDGDDAAGSPASLQFLRDAGVSPDALKIAGGPAAITDAVQAAVVAALA